MRLKQRDIDALKTAARDAFGETAEVRLYGSRVDDALRGGDIDVIIEADPLDEPYRAEHRFRMRLFEMIDDQKVDVLVAQRGKPLSAFGRCVYPGSVPLP